MPDINTNTEVSQQELVRVSGPNSEFDYGFECGCKAHQFYVKVGSYKQEGQIKDVLEERWKFHPCGDVRHYSVESVLNDIGYWKDRVNLFKRLDSKKETGKVKK